MTPNTTPPPRIRPDDQPFRVVRAVVGRFEGRERTPEGMCQAWDCENAATEEGEWHSCSTHALSHIFG